MSISLKFDNSLGATLIGFSVSCVVFGTLSTQCFSYFQRYPLDKPVYKVLVALIWCLELVDQIFIGHVVYFYTITHFNSPLFLVTGDVVWTLIVQVIMGTLVGTIVKACFAMRVWRFSNHNIPVTGLIVLLTFGQFGLAIAYAIRGFQLNKIALAGQLRLIASLSLGSGALTDIITAVALSFFLRRLRTGYRKSDTLVNSLTIYAINTGALTSAVSLCTLILYDVNPPTNLQYLAFYFVLSKLYAISFMCTLNTRKIIRGRGTDREGSTSNTGNLFGNTFVMVTNHSRMPRSHSQSAAHTKSQLEIGVHQEVSVISDVESPSIAAPHLGYNEPLRRGEQGSGWR